ncbi:MAG: ABC transporter permease [Chloroflexota bacterium]
MTAGTPATVIARPNPILTVLRKNTWTLGLLGFLAVLLLFTKVINPTYGASAVQNLGIAVLPLALAAVGQAIVVMSGGIDLSIGSLMALTSVISASLMKSAIDQSPGSAEAASVGIVLAVLVLGMLLGMVNGGLVVFTRVPDIVVTLAMSFVWAGCSLLVLVRPGGATAAWLKELVAGPLGSEWIPKSTVVMLVVVALVWIPVSRTRLGLSIYAIGSKRLAAFRSGVAVGPTRVMAYALMGLFAALGGLSLTATTGIGTPVPGPYTLMSVAAIVLGGVSLAGGRGGVFGPIVGVAVLQMIRTDMTFLKLDSNLATVLQGAILIGVVMIGSFVEIRRARP